MKNKRAVRQSNIELLRIVAMLIIIAHHFAYYNGYATAGVLNTAGGLWLQMMRVGGKIGVSVFVMISGYFLVNSSGFKIIKLLKLWLQILFYSILFYLIASLAQGSFDLSFETIRNTLLPLTYDHWWFASTYVVLFILSPFLNKMLHALSQKAYPAMLLVMLAIWYVVPTLLLQALRQTELTWFVFLYCLAGYIRLHGMRLFKHNYSYWIATAVAAAVNFILRVLFMEWGTKDELLSSYASDFSDLNKIPILIISLLLFLAFLHTEIKPKKWINTIASAAFGVYLIHEDPFIRQWLANNIFKRVDVRSTALIPYSIAVVLGIYLVAGLFELMRIHLIERWYSGGLNKLGGKLNGFFDRFLTRLGDKLSEKSDTK